MSEVTTIEHTLGFEAVALNKDKKWVPAIPEPYYGIRKECVCGRKFWTKEGYKAHYALEHILKY